MITRELLEAVGPVVDMLEELEAVYHIGGSLASSAYGFARSTLDVDLVADLHREQVPDFVRQLQGDYYIDEQMVFSAIEGRSSFSIIHLPTMIKVDVFIPKGGPFDAEGFRRAREEILVEDPETADLRVFYLASPEDVIIRKLDGYKAGVGVAEQQWLDVLGVLKVQTEALDYTYMKKWAAQLELSELLEQAMKESGLSYGLL